VSVTPAKPRVAPLEWDGETRCTTCGRPMIWCQARRSHKSLPVDPEPRADGNLFAVIGRGYKGAPLIDTTNQLPDPDLFTDTADVIPRYVSHFATCPQADQHRRAR